MHSKMKQVWFDQHRRVFMWLFGEAILSSNAGSRTDAVGDTNGGFMGLPPSGGTATSYQDNIFKHLDALRKSSAEAEARLGRTNTVSRH